MKLFTSHRRDAVAETGTGNAYTDAQTVWLERYGSYLQQAYNWRLIAILEAIGIIVAVLAIAYIGAQSKLVPYVVTIDKLGTPVGVQIADRAGPVDSRVIKAQLANFLVDTRSVVVDRVVEKQYLDNVYAMIANGSAARGYIDAWYTGHSPFDLARDRTISVTVDSLLAISPTTWQVQWTETQRNLGGVVTGSEQWVGSIGVAVRTPTDEATIMRNPLGVYVTSLNWTKKL